MNYTRQQIEHVQAVARYGERLDFQKFLEERYEELNELSSSVRDTDPVRHDYIETRMGELLTILVWVIERDVDNE